MRRGRRILVNAAAVALLATALPIGRASAQTLPLPNTVTRVCPAPGATFTVSGGGWAPSGGRLRWSNVQIVYTGYGTVPEIVLGSAPVGAGGTFTTSITLLPSVPIEGGWTFRQTSPFAATPLTQYVTYDPIKSGCTPSLTSGTPCLPASGGPLPLNGFVNRLYYSGSPDNSLIDVGFDIPTTNGGPVPHSQIIDHVGTVGYDGTIAITAAVPPLTPGRHRFYVGHGSFDGAYYYSPDDSGGTIVYVDITVPCPPAALVMSPTSLDFATMVVGGASAARSVTVTNVGSAPAPIQPPSLGGANPGDFAIDATTCAGVTLAPKQSCAVTAHFQPTATGALAATLTVSSANGGSVTGTLTGKGAETAITVTPSPVDFGTLTVGTDSPATTLTVTNAGTEPLPITSFKVTGPNGGEFVVDDTGCKGLTLDATAACTITVVFTPANAGPRSATLNVVAGPAKAKVALKGVGIYTPTLLFSPAVVHLGELTTAVGAGYPPNTVITLAWLEPDMRPVAPVTSDAAGGIKVVFLMIGGERLGARHLQPSAMPNIIAEPRPSAPLLVQAAPFRPQGANVTRIVAGNRISIVTRG